MSKVLILYGTTEGQTAKIAQRIAAVVAEHGYETALLDARRIPADFALTEYAGVIVGASMHVGGYQRAVRAFVARHATALARMPSAFFSVSLTAAYPEPKDRARLSSHLARFFEETGWHPATVVSFAGALAYSRYGLLKRLVMQSISRQVGAPTDPSRDYEFTDWREVTHFADAFAATLDTAQMAAPSGYASAHS